MTNANARRLMLTVAAPILALGVAFILTSLVLLALGDPSG